MKVLLLLLLAAVGQCALLGSKKCTYGPSYWCSHIRHAKECNAMQHCMTTVWKNQKLDIVGSTETCFSGIQVLDVVRRSNDDDIMRQMAIGCTGLPVEKRAVCKELMSHDQDDVYRLLKSDLSSRQVAAALGLCGGFPDTVPHHGVAEQVTGDYCTDCVAFMGDLRDIFNKSEGEVAAMIKAKVCSKLQALESVCDQLVDQYIPQVYEWLDKVMKPHDICLNLGMCRNQTHAELMKDIKNLMAKVGSVECDLCKDFAGVIKKFLGDQNVQTKIMDFLENDICSRLPGSYSTECKSYVKQYAPFVFSVLVAELDPETFCQDLHLCNSQTHASFVPKHQVSGAECDVCKTLASDAQDLLRDGTLQKDVLGFLENICQYLPGSLAAECKTYVAQYGPELFDLLVAELDPNTFCEKLGVCSGPKMEKSKVIHVPFSSLIGHFLLRPENKDKTVSGAACVLCEFVMSELERMIKNNATEKEIEDALQKVCSFLPSTLRNECDSFVKQYAPMIIKLLVADVSAEKVCTLLGLCSSVTVQTVKPVKPVKGMVECEICEKIMEAIKSALTEKTTEDELEHIVEKVCNLLPSSVKTKCDGIITAYFPAILNMLEQKIDPATICTDLDLCSAVTKTPSESHSLKFQPMLDLQPAKPHLLGTNECLYGPSYWCASVENAKKCGVRELCITKYGMKLEN